MMYMEGATIQSTMNVSKHKSVCGTCKNIILTVFAVVTLQKFIIKFTFCKLTVFTFSLQNVRGKYSTTFIL